MMSSRPSSRRPKVGWPISSEGSPTGTLSGVMPRGGERAEELERTLELVRERLGDDAEAARTEVKRARADADAARTELERARADAEAARAEVEKARAEAQAARA